MFQTTPTGNLETFRLFCVPHAGAGPSAFRGWASSLGPEIELTLIELPGREGRFREQPYVSMKPLIQDLCEAILPHLNDDRGFAFFGNSLGGLVAFETLHEIKRQSGYEAAHLFVSATGAPHLPSPLPLVAHLSDVDLLGEILTRYDGIPGEILADPEFLKAMLSIIRADMRVLESYVRPGISPLDCPITAFAGRYDQTVSLAEVEGWKSQTQASFDLLLLDEDHLYLQSARPKLTEIIRNTLLNVSCAR
ncbi:thioesterase II family protein [Acidicapsa ligni]|uniref:thioesterase II family protein n=1 Tax=Acidicapsa ligni TaxID=542300 RepID=UPI0021E0357D|nr:alpha/beta fold hydrolase [Acidicapsa ligni]